MGGRDEILRFIRYFHAAADTFTTDCCYWFAVILYVRFGAETMYVFVENHFVGRIDGRLYDVTGDVTEKYADADVVPWSDVEALDEALYRRLRRDCIYKQPQDDEIEYEGETEE